MLKIVSTYTEGIFPSVKSLENLPTEFTQYFYLYLSIFYILKIDYEFILGII
jgi:hypothetical protein